MTMLTKITFFALWVVWGLVLAMAGEKNPFGWVVHEEQE